jgi:hypothetical protein
LILGMDDGNGAPGRTGATRRTFLSASAATAVAVPLLSAATATAASAAELPNSVTDPGLRQLLGQVDPARIEATITRLVQFGTRHTSSSQTDPNRGIGAGRDHVSFQAQGYPAARITEPRENFNHEHRNVEVINGVKFGDRLEFVDFQYTARVAKVNAAALWALATNPATPKNVRIHVTPPADFAGINDTVLTWDANPETDLSGYEVVTRESTAPDWTQAIPVGNVTSVTLDITKDNLRSRPDRFTGLCAAPAV